MSSHLFAYLVKREEDLLIKGLSFDKKNWFLMPKQFRSYKFHPQMSVYLQVKECLRQKKVGRAQKVRVTQTIKSLYINNNDQLQFNGVLLEKDNCLKQDSIMEDIKRDLEEAKKTSCDHEEDKQLNYHDMNRKEVNNVNLNSTVKRPRTDFDTFDLSVIISQIIRDIGKFNLLNHSPEAFISKLEQADGLNDYKLNQLVNSFYKFLEKEEHPWFFGNIYHNGYSFDEFRTLFVGHAQRCLYEKVRSISLSLSEYNALFNSKNIDNPLKYYFESKSKMLKNYFGMNTYHSNLICLCFLEYSKFESFAPIIGDPDALDSMLDIYTSDNEIDSLMDNSIEEIKLPNLENVAENQANNQQNVISNDVHTLEIATLKKEINDLQLRNDSLENDIAQKDQMILKLRESSKKDNNKIKELQNLLDEAVKELEEFKSKK